VTPPPMSHPAPASQAPIATQSATGGTIDPATTSKRSPKSSSTAAFAAVGLATVMLLGGAGFFLVKQRRTTVTAPTPTPTPIPSPTPTPIPTPIPTPMACPSGMLPIPGGKFYMGSDERDALDFERPAHQVTLRPFCVDEFEVSLDRYKLCSDNGECKRAPRENEWDGISDKERAAFDPLCNARDPEKKGKHPINCVDFSMAQKFCEWEKKRLPTEAEWEFSARGPDGRKYPWGDESPAAGHLNACGKECVAWGKAHGQKLEAMYEADDGFANTAPIGSFAQGRSRYGVQDVVGNVWEWTADWYSPYGPKEQDDPKGSDTGERRVIRGGAWNGSEPAWVRPTFRYHDVPTKRSYGIGFRCAKSS